MIKYEGIKNKGNAKYLVMSNENSVDIWIPVEDAVADLIAKHIAVISTTATKAVERKNDEASD
jgi:hypothetical protein